MGGGGKSSSSGDDARQREEQRQARIRQGADSINRTFDSQFDDGVYNQRRDAYVAFARPQLDQQYEDATKQLAYALSRAGTSDSSIRGDNEAKLQKLYGTQIQAIADKGLDYANQARANVEQARGELTRTLASTADAEGAANAATARAGALAQPDSFSPLGQVFDDFLAGIGVQAAQERAQALSGGAYKAAVNTGLFAPRKQAVTVSQ